MTRLLALLLLATLLLHTACHRNAEHEMTAAATTPANAAPMNDSADTSHTPPHAASILADITLPALDGRPVDLARYHGQVVLLVNVASRCGHTPQYAGLQRLHERFADHGLVVIGVPSNDFGGQEPGTAEQIAEFCETNFGVTFTMLDKAPVKGDEKIELYRRLTDPDNDPTAGGEVQWNFEKFIIDRTGNVTARFRSGVQPESDEMLAAIEHALAPQ